MGMVAGNSIVDILKDKGLLPERTQRVVIDIDVNEVVTIYYQTVPNGLNLDQLFDDGKFIEVLKAADKIGLEGSVDDIELMDKEMP